jgi:phosphoribosylformimino-5-aminoimidazole carboxamide ribonucleotide (ProFAR) isomerase
VILGTAAAADPTFVRKAVEEHAEAIVVAIDVRGGRVMVRGWKEEGPAIEDAIPSLDDAGAPRFLVTSIARDGTLKGPDTKLYERILELTDTSVIASGGVRHAEDVWRLQDMGCEAVVTGKALYEKSLKLSQVIRGRP